jgi:hypothetical protein
MQIGRSVYHRAASNSSGMKANSPRVKKAPAEDTLEMLSAFTAHAELLWRRFVGRSV